MSSGGGGNEVGGMRVTLEDVYNAVQHLDQSHRERFHAAEGRLNATENMLDMLQRESARHGNEIEKLWQRQSSRLEQVDARLRSVEDHVSESAGFSKGMRATVYVLASLGIVGGAATVAEVIGVLG